MKARNKIQLCCSLAPSNHFEHAQTAFGMKRIKILFISSTHGIVEKKTEYANTPSSVFLWFPAVEVKVTCDYVL